MNIIVGWDGTQITYVDGNGNPAKDAHGKRDDRFAWCTEYYQLVVTFKIPPDHPFDAPPQAILNANTGQMACNKPVKVIQGPGNYPYTVSLTLVQGQVPKEEDPQVIIT